jgi:uncharacterized protein YdhG (YjbR/CyaY superfamily)
MENNVQKLIDTVSDERKTLLEKFRSIILELYPEATIGVSFQVPTYTFKQGWVSLGNWKNGVSIYTNSAHNIVEFCKKYPKIKHGTGCINFKLTDEVPFDDVKLVFKHALEQR